MADGLLELTSFGRKDGTSDFSVWQTISKQTVCFKAKGHVCKTENKKRTNTPLARQSPAPMTHQGPIESSTILCMALRMDASVKTLGVPSRCTAVSIIKRKFMRTKLFFAF